MVLILIEMFDPLGGEDARPAHDAVDLIALGQQELGQIGAILPGDACNQSYLAHVNVSQAVAADGGG